MRTHLTIILLAIVTRVSAQSESFSTNMGPLVVHPVQHASMVLYAGDKTIYIDPVGGAAPYKDFRKPDIILVTDIHGDHMNPATLDSVKTANTMVIVPRAVAGQLKWPDTSKLRVLNNGEETQSDGISVTAIPMYNLPESTDSRHVKGRGNGYVLSIGGKRVYISGDTEDIPEMRQLKNIDIAFVCMNLPYTMDVNQAASAVIEFKPKVVYPYHFRGQGGLSDVNAFKKQVNESDAGIEVRLVKWYPTN